MKKNSIALSTIIASWIPKLSLFLVFSGLLSFPVFGETTQTEIVGKPQVGEEQVTLKVKVKGENNRPEINLQATDFQVLLEGETIPGFEWKSPKEATPPPARIVILLDYSGSMNNPDSRGTSKIKGAIAAIRAFLKVASYQGGDIQVAIVPFGESRGTCQIPPVNEQSLDNFYPVGDGGLENYLKKLESGTPCASTDLYNPLIKTTNFLTTKFPPPDPNLPERQQTPQPRLSVILLSDGYHNRGSEVEDFEGLKLVLNQHPEIVVHTLGYGRTPEELGKLYKCDKTPATRKDIGEGKCKVPPEEFVDQQRLAEIAQLTGGVARFSANPEIIATDLKEFLNSILGEYEITFTHPRPERGKTYQVQVMANSVVSNSEYYRFLWSYLPLKVRMAMLTATIVVFLVGGVLPFWLWGKFLVKINSER
jgi:hypothetical protein